MTDQDQDYVKQLETEITRLRSMLARAGVTILPDPDLPNSKELDRLLTMVEAAHPQLKPPPGSDPASHKKQFAAALHYLAFVFRTDKPATQYAASFWIDECREFLRVQGIYIREMGLQPFVAAAVASRIVYEPLEEFPYSINLGLSLGGVGHPSNAWRDVLKAGIPKPVEPKYRRHPQTVHNWA